MIALVRRLRSRLVVTIYFAGLVQFAIVVAATVALAEHARPTFAQMHGDTARLLVDGIARAAGDTSALRREVDRVHFLTRWTLAVYDDHDALLAATTPPPAGAEREWEGGVASFAMPSGGQGRVVYAVDEPHLSALRVALPVLAIVVVVVGVASWLAARYLAVPLARLSSAANAFGAGQLDVRVAMKQRDELGEVADAFDAMAERVMTLVRAERELLANVSHELRTPLARIRVALDLAAEGDTDTARAVLGEIAEDLVELERIVDDVLSAARLSLRDGAVTATAVPPIRAEIVDAGALVDKAAARFRVAHATRPLDVEIRGALPAISGDPVLLRRVIDNLLDNAHTYTEAPDAGIVLSATASAGSVAIEVRDAGVGIAPDDLARVFEPFFRADRSRTRKTGGLGLGLTLARRIVDAHGGTLRLSSGVGRGTVARIELPPCASA